MSSLVHEILVGITPGIIATVICLIVTYLVGHLQNKWAVKREAAKEAYESFYLPFISLMYLTDIWYFNFSSLTEDMQTKYFKLIMNNIRYMDEKILDEVDGFYGCYARETVAGTGLPNTNDFFESIVVAVLEHADGLAEILKMPKLGGHALAIYQESAEVRAKRENYEKRQSEDPDTQEDEQRAKSDPF